MSFKTADLCDAHPEVLIAQPLFRDYGGRATFGGPIATVKAVGDNSLVRAALSEPGDGRVLVVDGGGSQRCALLGDRLAALAVANGWSGVLVHGCIRDAEQIAALDLGVKALGLFPRKTEKRGAGERDVPVAFAGLTFRPGHCLYADRDGVLLSALPLA